MPMTRTLHEELRAETRKEHEDLESALDLMGEDFSIEDYRTLLVQYYDFYATLEAFLRDVYAQAPELDHLRAGVRHRREWLGDDIRALGLTLPQPGITQEQFRTLYPEVAHLFGAMYVIEGSALGGVVLAKHFVKTLGITDIGMQFFHGHGQKTRERWSTTLQLLAAHESSGLAREKIVRGARTTFSFLHRQLAGAVSS